MVNIFGTQVPEIYFASHSTVHTSFAFLQIHLFISESRNPFNSTCQGFVILRAKLGIELGLYNNNNNNLQKFGRDGIHNPKHNMTERLEGII